MKSIGIKKTQRRKCRCYYFTRKPPEGKVKTNMVLKLSPVLTPTSIGFALRILLKYAKDFAVSGTSEQKLLELHLNLLEEAHHLHGRTTYTLQKYKDFKPLIRI
jgi:hypothetical protein